MSPDDFKNYFFISIGLIVFFTVVLITVRLNFDIGENGDYQPGIFFQIDKYLVTTGIKSPVSSPSYQSYPRIDSLPPGKFDVLITYTDEGFKPKSIEIKAGQSVRFLNLSSHAMRINAKSLNTYPYAKSLSAGVSLSYNKAYDVSFSERGLWTYENFNRTSDDGEIIVR